MMQAAEYGSLHNPVPDRQTVSALVRRNLVRHGLRQTGAHRRVGPSAVIVNCPIPNRHLQMAFIEGNQEVQTFPTKAAARNNSQLCSRWIHSQSVGSVFLSRPGTRANWRVSTTRTSKPVASNTSCGAI